MKSKILALFLLAGSSMFAGTRVFVGVGVGPGPGYYVAPPPAPVVAYAPGYYARPGYTWIAGYWYPVGPRYYWHAGYWARPPYTGAYWVRLALTDIDTIAVTGADKRNLEFLESGEAQGNNKASLVNLSGRSSTSAA